MTQLQLRAKPLLMVPVVQAVPVVVVLVAEVDQVE
jgi:hypothetical protein